MRIRYPQRPAAGGDAAARLSHFARSGFARGEYQTLVKPALRWLDYLVINELEAQALTGIELRSSGTLASPAAFAAAARWLLAQGVRQRVVIHAPEGAWGQQPAGDGLWQPAWCLAAEEIVGSVGAGDAFCAGVLYASHQDYSLQQALSWPIPAPALICMRPTRWTASGH